MDNNLRESLEEAGIESSVADEILNRLDEAKTPVPTSTQDVEAYLKLALNNTTEWRRKAQIAAQVISNYYK